MTKYSIGFLTLCLTLLPQMASAQKKTAPEWCDETVNEVNRELSRTTAIPVTCEEMSTIEDSPYYLSLNGTWKFFWTDDPAKVPAGFAAPAFDISTWDEIKVPANWQIEAVRNGKDWDKPLYCNTIYPFTPVRGAQWPNVIQPRPENYTYAKMVDPVGLYRRTFSIPEEWAGRDVFIRFNGVEAGYYLFVNGKQVGFSEDSYLPSEFNLTPYLAEGENTLALQVFRFSDGSYLECQDFWRLSGIFRDVFLWSAPKTQIRDFIFETDLDKDYKDASVSLDVEITGPKRASGNITAKITDSKGTIVAQSTSEVKLGLNKLALSVSDPQKWTAETPNLYTLSLSLEQKGKVIDIRSEKVGFRKVELAPDGRFLVNGKEVIFKGVDRHDHSALNGRCISREETELDIKIMKSLNINAIRTSHYPDNPYFYDLCDKYGIYVLAEADVECHGLTNLSKEPSWEHAFVERNVNHVRRFRNHTCIVIWSLGNESGNGLNHKAAVAAIKELDTTRPVHYEGNSSFCDLTSRMYSNVIEVGKTGKERQDKFAASETVQPHVLCEYAHAMGNAIGNLKEYVDTFETYPALIGGFIWDWVDQGIQMPTPDGKGTYMAVGGDFGDIPNDGNFCTNGVIFADRTYAPKALQVKKCYEPVSVTYKQTGNQFSLSFINKRDHINTSDLEFRYEVLKDGFAISNGEFADMIINPGETASAEFSFNVPDNDPAADYDLRISFIEKNETLWQSAGYEVSSEQICLQKGIRPAFKPSKGWLSVEQNADAITVKGIRFSATFCAKTGSLESYIISGKELISKGPALNVSEAPTDNDKGLVRQWNRIGLFDMTRSVGEWKVEKGADCVTLSISNAYAGREGFGMSDAVTYKVFPGGEILVEGCIDTDSENITVPRIGYKMRLAEGVDRMRWRGRGPFENYSDRAEAALPGVYDASVKDQYIKYIRPQKMGVRTDVNWVALNAQRGEGLLFVSDTPFSFSAMDMDEDDMIFHEEPSKMKHTYEVPRLDETVFCLDFKHRGLGNASCGPGPLPKYDLKAGKTEFKYMILPLARDYSTDELILKARVSWPEK